MIRPFSCCEPATLSVAAAQERPCRSGTHSGGLLSIHGSPARWPGRFAELVPSTACSSGAARQPGTGRSTDQCHKDIQQLLCSGKALSSESPGCRHGVASTGQTRLSKAFKQEQQLCCDRWRSDNPFTIIGRQQTQSFREAGKAALPWRHSCKVCGIQCKLLTCMWVAGRYWTLIEECSPKIMRPKSSLRLYGEAMRFVS